MEQNKQSRRNDNHYCYESWKYHFNPFYAALYEHFYPLLPEK
jgi:hypothetical protein